MRKLAGRNTAKFRGQVREVFRASERNHTDDLFAATPFRKRLAQGKTRAESRDLDNAEDQAQSDESDSNFDFDTSIATPNPKALASAERPAARRGLKGKGSRAGAAQDEGASVDVRVAGESEGEDDQDDLQYINEEERRRADRYIAGVAKRRKVAGRHLRGAQAGQRSESAAGSLTPQMGQTKAKVDTEAVLDDGIKGNFTPGGSVRISVRPEHFVYEFSDEDEGFDDDDDDDDDEEAEE
ncbi:Hypothetical Protein FCC1311_059192 [Hondaea fermentalgiana]|uniref:Uncharacterized protein n=1 Tax=Hondaea fermentalgiana TaxID=2315210 RepID=A0A2R5GIZ4_9STRA|nr:Hypothetical Protein FCC1311_059192 [Hondaea fermentalgiana]|eukprot:GBG29698.1 Hypothetical Protein FCC1311_059192 [Hondaea fermentalgiana]